MKVERNVKIPTRKRASKYPWSDLKVGDSFFVHGAEKMYAMYAAVANYNKKLKKPIKITLRKEGDGVRVWRIK